jgi:2-iminobutanoate/2-iminopropanoate deaminase
MGCDVIQTSEAPSAIGPYSQAIRVGSWVFVSGQIGLDPKTGDMVEGGFEGQTRQVLDNMKSILKAAGLTLKNVASVDVFLTDMGQFATFNGIYQEYFSEHQPARAVVEVKGLPKWARVEIKCIAFMPQ